MATFPSSFRVLFPGTVMGDCDGRGEQRPARCSAGTCVCHLPQERPAQLRFKVSAFIGRLSWFTGTRGLEAAEHSAQNGRWQRLASGSPALARRSRSGSRSRLVGSALRTAQCETRQAPSACSPRGPPPRPLQARWWPGTAPGTVLGCNQQPTGCHQEPLPRCQVKMPPF